MKVTCKKNIIKKDEKIIQLYKHSPGFKDIENYTELAIEHEYTVMAIDINSNNTCLFYLINPENYDPHWYPSTLFDISDNRIPKNWFFKLDDTSSSYILGFYEIAYDNSFYSKLFDGDKETEYIYYKRKKEYEETHTLELFKKFNVRYSWLTVYVGKKLGNFSVKEIEKYAEEYLAEHPDCTNRYIVQFVCHEIAEEDVERTLLKILKDLHLECIEEGSEQWMAEANKWNISHSQDY